MATIILTPGEYRLIPPGHYRLRVEKIEEVPVGPKVKKAFLSWTCEIVEDLDKVGVIGEKYYFNTPKTIPSFGNSKWWQFLTKVNPSLENIGKSTSVSEGMKFDPTKTVDEGGLIGCEFYAECIIRDKVGVEGEKNDFKAGGVRSLEEFDEYIQKLSKMRKRDTARKRVQIKRSPSSSSMKKKSSRQWTDEEIDEMARELKQEEEEAARRAMEDDLDEYLE